LIGGISSIIIGCLGALDQYRIKKFLAYTSINQIGFLILSISLNNLQTLSSSFLFLFIYLIMNIIFFSLILNIEHLTTNFKIIFLTDLYCLDYYNPKLNILWSITLFSMAGIPPTAGFFTKFFILLNIINYSYYFIVILTLISTIISTYYYLTFIKYLLFEKKQLVNLYFIDVTIIKLIYPILIISFIILLAFFFIPNIFYTIFLLTTSCKFILSSELLILN